MGSTSHRDRFIDICEARLLSCHGQYLPTAKRWLAEAHNHPRAKERFILLDSGAFTSWSRGEHITLNEVMRNYSAIIDRFGPFYKQFYLINLDVIPGSKGVTPTAAQIDAAIKQSDENYAILYDKFGPCVLPVFHQGESKDRLQEVARLNPDYICVSPRNDLGEAQRVPWMQRVHALCKGVKTHGLAATGVDMMLSTGLFSTDSATWVQLAGFGGILVPFRDGMKEIKISRDSPNRRYYGLHYDSASADVRRVVEDRAERLGVTIEELRTKPGPREWWNINTLEQISKYSDRDTKPQDTLWEF